MSHAKIIVAGVSIDLDDPDATAEHLAAVAYVYAEKAAQLRSERPQGSATGFTGILPPQPGYGYGNGLNQPRQRQHHNGESTP